MEKNSTKLIIGYLTNPDKVYYNEMDDHIIKYLEEYGAQVIKLNLEEIAFSITKGNVDILFKKEKINLNGFLSYGYMSKFHYESYWYIISTLHNMGIPCLHTPEVERILNNKYLQSLCYSKAKVPIPLTQIGFSIPSFKNLGATYLPEKSVLKRLDDYGGDGVSLLQNKENLVNSAAKLLWNNEYCLFQEFISDSTGKSIRVFCINGKGVLSTEYIDKTNNFKSNNSFGYDFFSMESLMDSPKLKEYFSLAEKAVASIGNITIGGVDILDSKEKGLVVLEVNGWPDIWDISHSTGIDGFKLFTQAFYEKVLEYNERKNKKKLENIKI
jgi:glutathione synthase/RimK-type ligase-like ATP-grasp enzyme